MTVSPLLTSLGVLFTLALAFLLTGLVGVLIGYLLSRGRPATPRAVPLATLLRTVALEIHKANAELHVNGRPAVMEFESAQVEVAFETEKSAEIGGTGEGLTLFALEFKGGVRRTDTNTLTLTYKKLPGTSYQAPVQPGEAGALPPGWEFTPAEGNPPPGGA